MAAADKGERSRDVSHRAPLTGEPAFRADSVIAMVALLLGSGMFLDLIGPSPYGWLANDVLWPALYLLVGASMGLRDGYGWILWSLEQLPLLCAVMAISVLSTLWSYDPWRAFHGAAALVGTTMVGISIGYRLTSRELMNVVTLVLVVILGVNLLVCALDPAYGIESFNRGYLPYRWKGAMTDSNSLGWLAAITLILSVAGFLTDCFGAVKAGALAAAAAALVVTTQSATAILALLAGLVTMFCFYLSKRLRIPSMVTALVMMLTLITAVPFVVAQPELVAEPLGRDATFTTRTAIWQDALKLIEERPLIGYGEDSIWGQRRATWFPDLKSTRTAPHAHNGYLQVAAELGLPAAALALGHLLWTLFLGLECFRRQFGTFTLFALPALVMMLVVNLSESVLFRDQHTIWLLFVAIGTALARRWAPPPRRWAPPHRRRYLARSAGRSGHRLST
jgi:exopolysaccharide production protein ExoQ